MDNRLSEAEIKTFNRFMRTELGEKVLANVKGLAQAQVDKAILGINRGNAYTHDCIVSAAAIESVYDYLKPPEAKTEDE